MARVHAEREVEGETDESEQRDDLERETGDHDVVSEFRVFPGVRFGGGDAAAGGLEEEGDDVARDELRLLVAEPVWQLKVGRGLTMRVYHFGGMREFWAPNAPTMRRRQR